MPHILKLVMALMIAGLALTACGPASEGGGGETPSEDAAPSDNTTAQ